MSQVSFTWLEREAIYKAALLPHKCLSIPLGFTYFFYHYRLYDLQGVEEGILSHLKIQQLDAPMHQRSSIRMR